MLRSRQLTAARRRGKLILVDTDAGAVLGMHLGMSGRVPIDGEAAGDPLVYASNRAVSAWHRFGLKFADGGSLYLRDPRRLGAVELDPDEERLGPDAFDVTLPYLRDVVSRSRAPVKAVIMDQSRIAGLGNLLCDEALWRAGVNPAAPRTRSPTTTSVGSTARSATRSASSAAAAGHTPATSRRSGSPARTARRTARRCSGARSVAARHTPARSTRSDLRRPSGSATMIGQ